MCAASPVLGAFEESGRYFAFPTLSFSLSVCRLNLNDPWSPHLVAKQKYLTAVN